MSDEQKQKQPGENPERDVAGLLEQAESLSNELGAEVGAEPVPPTEREKEFFESETDSEASLDLQLAQAETALESAKSEITDTPPSPPAKKVSLPPRKKPGSVSTVEEASPRSEERPVSENGTRESGQSASAGGNPAGGNQDRANTQAAKPIGDGVATATADRKGQPVENLVAARISATPYEFEPPQPSRFQAVCAKFNLSRWISILGPLANIAASILEICDRPFVRINRVTRQVLGWLSLAFATAALATMLFMVF